MSKKIKFIVNPIAGFRRDKQFIIERLQRLSPEIDLTIETTSCRGDAGARAAAAARDGFDIAVAVGGDGTVNEVASGLVGTATALGIIPLGSGNGLARSVGIPMSTEQAIAVISRSNRRRIDVGRAGHRNFFVVTGVGFDAAVGKLFDGTHMRGPLPYFYLGIKHLMNYQPRELHLRFAAHRLTLTPFLVTVANTCQYGNGAKIAPHARCDDGQLDICVITESNKMAILRYLPNLVNGTIDQVSLVQYYQGTDIVIEGDSPLLFHVDGEPDTVEGPLNISILPKALQVIAPEQ
jgi:YegS/Rv2252/BmrU family lipid kinase